MNCGETPTEKLDLSCCAISRTLGAERLTSDNRSDSAASTPVADANTVARGGCDMGTSGGRHANCKPTGEAYDFPESICIASTARFRAKTDVDRMMTS